MRGHKESPPGRDRGGQVPRGLTTPTGDSIVAQPRSPMRREDLPPTWGGPPEFPPQQHQLAQSAEFGKRVLRHQRHENDLYYRVQIPLTTVLQWRYDNGTNRALTWTREDESTKALRRLSISLRYGRMKCGCVGSHLWFAPCNPYAQADYEGELLGAVRP